jgi:ABC-type long-subunit fatty acid transport system fused permease/ATPase subunit
MKAMLGISLLAVLISTSNNTMLLLLLLNSTLQQNWRKAQNRFYLEVWGERGRGRGKGRREK